MQTKQLNDIASFSSGMYSKSRARGDVKYLQAVHFNEFGKLDSMVKPQLQEDKKLNKHYLHHEDVIFAAKGSHNFGVVYYSGYGKAVASSSFIVIRINDNIKASLMPEYLAWFMTNSPQIQDIRRRQMGSTIPSISIKKLKDIVVPLPDLKKQNTILKVQALRNRQKELVEQLEDARESQIQKLLIKSLSQN